MRAPKARAKLFGYFARKQHMTSSFSNSMGATALGCHPPPGAYGFYLSQSGHWSRRGRCPPFVLRDNDGVNDSSCTVYLIQHSHQLWQEYNMSLCLFMAQIPRPAQQRGVDSQPYMDICAFWLKTWETILMHEPTLLHLTWFSNLSCLNHNGYRFMCLVLSKIIEQVFVNGHVITIWVHICCRTKM